MLAVNHLGVVTRLAEACHRLGCNQEKLLRVCEQFLISVKFNIHVYGNICYEM
jgi:hypothetical protein